jgi:2'-phosphotransferase
LEKLKKIENLNILNNNIILYKMGKSFKQNTKTHGSNKFDAVDVSKTMSWILRHGLVECFDTKFIGLDGTVPLDLFLSCPRITKYNMDFDSIQKIVESNDKQRFRLENINGMWRIGANQGHSKTTTELIDPSKLLERIEEPIELCVHGTSLHAIKLIEKEGLKIMNRTHIHMASGYPGPGTEVISGARTSSKVFIEIDMEKALADGIIFYRSVNGVILTSGIDGVLEPKYFSKIVYK